MSTTYQAKLVYGIDARLAKFHDNKDKTRLVYGWTLNNTEYFFQQNIFGEVIAEVEEDSYEVITLDMFKGIVPDESVFSSNEGFKLYLIVDSY